MGYYVSQTDRNFFVPADKIAALVEHIKSLALYDNLMSGGSYYGGEKISKHYAWVNMNFVNADNVIDMFKCWRWSVELDTTTGDIVDIYFNGEKLGDDYVLFKNIASFVKPGSFIEMRGEENDMWRWHFNGETCVEQYPKITWHELEVI